MLPRRAGSDFANSFEQFWSGLVPSRDRLRTPGPGAYSNSDAGLRATSSSIRQPVVRLPPRLPATHLPQRLVSVSLDSTPGVGQYDLDDGIGGRKWRAQHSRPGGGLPTSSVSHRGSSTLARAAQARMREHRAAAVRSQQMMETDMARLSTSSQGVITDNRASDPGKPDSRSAVIGTDGLHNFDASNRLGYRSGWVTGMVHCRELKETKTGPGAYDTQRGEAATSRGSGGFARFAKSGGRRALPTFSRCARFGAERGVGTVGTVHVQSRESRTEHFIRTRPMTTTPHGHYARIRRAHKLARKAVGAGGVGFSRRKGEAEEKAVDEMGEDGTRGGGGEEDWYTEELGLTGVDAPMMRGGDSDPDTDEEADMHRAPAAAAAAAAADREGHSVGAEEEGATEPVHRAPGRASTAGAVPDLDMGRVSRSSGIAGGSARRPAGRAPDSSGRGGGASTARAALRSSAGLAEGLGRGGGGNQQAGRRGLDKGGGGADEGGGDDAMSAREAAWEDEVLLGMADTYARHERDFVAHNKYEVAVASRDPDGKLPSQRRAHKLDERLAAFRERRAAILQGQKEHHEQLKRDYDLKLVRKQQRLWLTFVNMASRAHRMQRAVRGKRAERVSIQVLRALGLHKQRVFRAWAAWVKHRRLLWATTVFKARLRPVVRRFRIASRMRKVGVMIDFLESVQDTNNAVRAARIFYTRILKLQVFWRECLSSTRAQKDLLRKQFLRAGLAIRVQGLKRRLRNERRKSEVDKQMTALARRQAQEEERAKSFLKRQQFWAAQSGSPGSDDEDDAGHAGAYGASRAPTGAAASASSSSSSSFSGVQQQRHGNQLPPPPPRGRRLVGRATATSTRPERGTRQPHRPDASGGGGDSQGGRGSSVSQKRAERRRRRSSMVASINQTERYLEATEEALRSLGVIKQARRKSTVVGDGADMEAAAAAATGRGGRRASDASDGTPRAGTGRGGGGGGGGASHVDSAAEDQRRKSIFRADGDEDTQWETILAKIISQKPPEDVEAEAEKEVLDMEDGAAGASMLGARGGVRPHRPSGAVAPPPSPLRPSAPSSGRRMSAAGPTLASLSAEERRARAVVADLPVTRTDASADNDGDDDDGHGPRAGRKAPRTRRLSIEMAVMRVRTLEEWPPIPDTRLDTILTQILRRHRKTHHRSMNRYREKLHVWDLGFEAEVRKAEARIASIRNRKITKAEKSAIREYLRARRPLSPRFFVLEPWNAMLDIVREAMIEQRQMDADEV